VREHLLIDGKKKMTDHSGPGSQEGEGGKFSFLTEAKHERGTFNLVVRKGKITKKKISTTT